MVHGHQHKIACDIHGESDGRFDQQCSCNDERQVLLDPGQCRTCRAEGRIPRRVPVDQSSNRGSSFGMGGQTGPGTGEAEQSQDDRGRRSRREDSQDRYEQQREERAQSGSRPTRQDRRPPRSELDRVRGRDSRSQSPRFDEPSEPLRDRPPPATESGRQYRERSVDRAGHSGTDRAPHEPLRSFSGELGSNLSPNVLEPRLARRESPRDDPRGLASSGLRSLHPSSHQTYSSSGFETGPSLGYSDTSHSLMGDAPPLENQLTRGSSVSGFGQSNTYSTVQTSGARPYGSQPYGIQPYGTQPYGTQSHGPHSYRMLAPTIPGTQHPANQPPVTAQPQSHETQSHGSQSYQLLAPAVPGTQPPATAQLQSEAWPAGWYTPRADQIQPWVGPMLKTEPPAKKGSKWSKEEDSKLVRLKMEGKSWEDITKILDGRLTGGCLHRWQYICDSDWVALSGYMRAWYS